MSVPEYSTFMQLMSALGKITDTRAEKNSSLSGEALGLLLKAFHQRVFHHRVFGKDLFTHPLIFFIE